ncbi:hypothetical protein K1X84_16875, partial [bacterium]|nr:hypothetical protein [bacterium]
MKTNVLDLVLNSFRKSENVWLLGWLTGVVVVWTWDYFFLNTPALRQIESAFLNTGIVSLLAVFLALTWSWPMAIILHFIKTYRSIYIATSFFLNIIRSVPQIIGVLIGYTVLTFLIEREILESFNIKLFSMAVVISLFIFLELFDSLQERIRWFQRSDFYPAMLVSGVRESRIVQYDILWKNSRSQIINKLIAMFGTAIFLQCSIDFIISVGLSTEVSSQNFPATLGSLLAKMDSKKDILAIGNSLLNPEYIPRLFTTHLQGVTVAFLIVFSLISVYMINKAYAL